jgi:NADH-quinone oxidoreductase subunit F
MEIMAEVRQTLDDHDLKAEIIEVGCIGPCYLEPLMDIALPGRPRISYANVTAKKARAIVESCLVEDDPRLSLAVGHFGEDTSESRVFLIFPC